MAEVTNVTQSFTCTTAITFSSTKTPRRGNAGVDSERFLRKQAKVLLQKHDGRASQRRLSNHPQEGPWSNVPLVLD